MTDKAPERIWAWRYNDPWGNELRWFEWDGHDPSPLDTEYVRADLLEAANARIADLEKAVQAFADFDAMQTVAKRPDVFEIRVRQPLLRALKGGSNE